MRGDLEGNTGWMDSRQGVGGSTGKVMEEEGMLMLKEQQVVCSAGGQGSWEKVVEMRAHRSGRGPSVTGVYARLER